MVDVLTSELDMEPPYSCGLATFDLSASP